MTTLGLFFGGFLQRRISWVCAALVLAAVWWWQLRALQESRELMWLAVTALSVLSGFAALGWLRPARVGITAPQAMLLLGTLGMLCGLTWDTRSVGLEALASLCAVRAPDWVEIARLHLEWLPAMHAGMIAGGLAALVLLRRARHGCRRQFCARFVQNLACSGWMLAGMSAGVALYYRLAPLLGGSGASAMLGGMIGGMIWGMVVSVALYRLYCAAWSVRTRSLPAQANPSPAEN
ncbi:MAG: hypothetical protein WBM28_13840 [Burkholderiales bacterium]